MPALTTGKMPVPRRGQDADATMSTYSTYRIATASDIYYSNLDEPFRDFDT